jgi:hypothetical protein
MEIASHAIEERVIKILGTQHEQQIALGKIIRSVYRLRAQHGTIEWNAIDYEFFAEFIKITYSILLVALKCTDHYNFKTEFIKSI